MIEIKKAELVAVTADPKQYPPDELYEIAFAGRSNVGKSSLLNLLTTERSWQGYLKVRVRQEL